MFFILSKLFSFLLQPFVWILIVFSISMFMRNPKTKNRLTAFGLGALLFFSNTVVYSEFLRLWETGDKSLRSVPKSDIAILLTGMASYNNDWNRLELNSNGDRIWQTMKLYFSGKVKMILITGDSGMLGDRGLHEAKQLAADLVTFGVPKSTILVEAKSQNTYENALFTAQLLKQKKLLEKNLVLITNGSHMKRALACFHKQNLKPIPFAVRLGTGPKRTYHVEQYFLPNAETLFKWDNLTKEWFGYLTYKLAGYL